MLRAAAYALPLVEVIRTPGAMAADAVSFHTVRGDIGGQYHPVAGGIASAGVVLLPGTQGSSAGAAGEPSSTLATGLQLRGVEALRIGYRRAPHLDECVRDSLVAVRWLARERGLERVALVGHGFGSAVAITAGSAAEEVVAVAALAASAAQCAGAEALDVPFFRGRVDLLGELLAWLCERL